MSQLLPAAMMLNAPANPGSRSNLSEPDEDFDYDKLMTHEMYDTRQPTIAGNYMVNAEVLAHQSIELILDNVTNILHEKYINSKLDGHTIESTYDLVELLFNTEFISYDHQSFADDADSEPVLVDFFFWFIYLFSPLSPLIIGEGPKLHLKKSQELKVPTSILIFLLLHYLKTCCYLTLFCLAHNEFNDNIESMLSEDRKALQRAKEIGRK